MSTDKRLTTRETAEYLGLCKQRISAKIIQGHYPHASKCECGMTMMIPLTDINKDLKAGTIKRIRK